ncbi:MAG: sugar phosphate isomerase/epimerase family protein [Bacillota bacterium]
MKNVIVPLNAFNRNEVLEKGQEAFIERVALSGAYGIEIRRELFPEEDMPLEEIKMEIEKFKLFIVFSASVELWTIKGQLDKDSLQRTFEEARNLGAAWVKVSLGHYYPESSSCTELKDFLKQLNYENGNIQLLVENDQTLHGGSVERLKCFLKNASLSEVPVKMTFDIGNWHYTEQNVQYALEQLATYVSYLHLKHVEKREDVLVTLPLPYDKDAEWRQIVNRFPAHVTKAIEFPIDPISKAKKYIEMVQEAVIEESGVTICNN